MLCIKMEFAAAYSDGNTATATTKNQTKRSQVMNMVTVVNAEDTISFKLRDILLSSEICVESAYFARSSSEFKIPPEDKGKVRVLQSRSNRESSRNFFEKVFRLPVPPPKRVVLGEIEFDKNSNLWTFNFFGRDNSVIVMKLSMMIASKFAVDVQTIMKTEETKLELYTSDLLEIG